jgi:hypothetical protein
MLACTQALTWQRKAFEWHPDRNRGKPTEKEATEKFRRIKAAYDRLNEVACNIELSALHLVRFSYICKLLWMTPMPST